MSFALGYGPFEGMICHRFTTRSTFVNYGQLNPSSHFSNDLGLDSLDTVEVVMAIEEVCLLFCPVMAAKYLTWNRNSALRSQIRMPMLSSVVGLP
jgi:hypothetical protein